MMLFCVRNFVYKCEITLILQVVLLRLQESSFFYIDFTLDQQNLKKEKIMMY